MAKDRKKTSLEIEDERLAKGRCYICGEKRGGSKLYCKKHLDAHRKRQRRYSGSKPWRPGQKGRPPLDNRG